MNLPFRLQFLGATQTVTGSRFLLTLGPNTDPERVLVDCGLFQGYKNYREKNWAAFPVRESSISSILLTHAHIDHSGFIPRLVKQGFRGRVYATRETIDLCQIMLPDAGMIQEEEADYANKKQYSKHSPALPLFTEREARESLKYFEPVEWNRPFVLPKSAPKLPIEVTFLPAGHILGASSILVKAQGRSVLFSGDLGRPNDAMMDPPPGAADANTILVESTYGNRRHPMDASADQLAAAICQVVNRKGIVLIPTFAVGRAQLLLHMLVELKAAGKIPNVPVYLNSPMAKKVNGVFSQYPNSTRLSSKEMNHALSQSIAIESAEESIALNSRTEPMIILAASGMMTGGRVLHHLKAFAGDPKNAIVFSGFQVPGTRGHQILSGEREIKIHGDYVTVRAEILSIEGLSAHGDQNDLINWLKPIADAHPKNKPRLFFVHGDIEAAEGLRRAVQKNLMWAGRVPDPFEEIDL